MNKLKLLSILFLTTAVLGCSSSGVIYTVDPMQKLVNGYDLMNQGRAIPAERLGKEALASFTGSSDQNGIAESHIFLGQLYKHKAYRDAADFYKKNNEYDPTNRKSISHTQQAIDIYEAMGNYVQMAKGQFALANAYLSSDNSKSCSLYEESITSIAKGKIENPGESFQFNPSYGSAEEMINSFKAKYCGTGS